MRFQTERCLQCGRPTRPTNFKSDYSLTKTGAFPGTDYWLCSDDCYVAAISDCVEDKEYLPKYGFEPGFKLAPRIKRECDKIADQYIEIYEKLSYEYVEEHLDEIKAKMREEQLPLIRKWQDEQSAAVHKAGEVLWARVREEWAHESKKREEDQRMREEKEAERIRREAERQEDRQRREKERLEREAERQQKEQERLEEKRQKEEERRRIEEERLERERLEEEARAEAMRPREIPMSARFSHTHVLGASGSGKTTLIIKHVKEDLERPYIQTIIVIDPKGTLVDRLSRYEDFRVASTDIIDSDDEEEELAIEQSSLVLIDPAKYVPALNMFAKPKRTYSGAFAQQMENNTISLFQYVFSSKDAALTDKQLTCFSYAMKLLMAMPSANIQTLLDLLEDPCVPKIGGVPPTSPFKPYIEMLDQTAQRFFLRNFYDVSDYAATKEQIATRIHGLLRYPAFAKMFLTDENKIDMFAILQYPGTRVVLISSPVSVLGLEGSRLFSRYMVALTLQAIFERAMIPRHKWKPAYLYIDEAQLVVDETKTQELLQLAREFRLGCTLLHHQIEGEITPKIFATLSANTRIKYAATNSYPDASTMSKDMRCEPNFIMDRVPNEGDTHGSFACFCSGVTPHPFIYELDFKEDNDFPKMSDDGYSVLCKYMEETYGVKEGPPKDPLPAPLRDQTTDTRDASTGVSRAAQPHADDNVAKIRPPARSQPQSVREHTTPSSVNAGNPDPHTGDHTEPASKWGDE